MAAFDKGIVASLESKLTNPTVYNQVDRITQRSAARGPSVRGGRRPRLPCQCTSDYQSSEIPPFFGVAVLPGFGSTIAPTCEASVVLLLVNEHDFCERWYDATLAERHELMTSIIVTSCLDVCAADMFLLKTKFIV